MLKSWYTGFFQIPVLPEIVSSAFYYKLLEQTMVQTACKKTFFPTDITQYKIAWRRKGAITAMINWYRAFKYNPATAADLIVVPTLLIWGKKDFFLEAEMAPLSVEKCQTGKLVFISDATHWLHHEKPEEVNQLILNFIQ